MGNLKKSILLATFAGSTALNSLAYRGQLDVRNTTSSSDLTIGVKSIGFRENAGNLKYYPYPQSTNSFEIYCSESTNSWGQVGITNTQKKIFVCPLFYRGSIPSDTPNMIRWQFYDSSLGSYVSTNNLPKNLLITSKVIDREHTNVVDVPKLIKESTNNIYMGAQYGEVLLPVTTNAQNGEIYATNWMCFEPLEQPRILSVQKNLDGRVSMNVQAQPASYLEVQAFSDLAHPTNNTCSITNHYVAPTEYNFGTNENVNFTFNAPAISPCYFRVKANAVSPESN